MSAAISFASKELIIYEASGSNNTLINNATVIMIIVVDTDIQQILDKFPFLSYGKMQDRAYLGIIQNSDNQLLSMYLIDLIPDEHLRKHFLACGASWWWDSNRLVPINIFLKDKFRIFRPFLKHFSRKDFDLIAGPAVSLQETIARRVRKRQITLVRRPP